MQGKRRSGFRVGMVMALVGLVIGLMGVIVGPAQATPGEQHKVTICHRTNSVTNPYRVITVDIASANGLKKAANHDHHDGPAFDFSADPAVKYPPPHDGDQWGDIIPAYDDGNGHTYAGTEAWQTGYDGNADAGKDILANDCQGPNEPPICDEAAAPASNDEVVEQDPCEPPCDDAAAAAPATAEVQGDDDACPTQQNFECPEGTSGSDANDNGDVDEGECLPPFACPEGTSGTDANSNGVVDEGECVEAHVEEFSCPTNLEWTDANHDGKMSADECNEVLGEVITPAAPVAVQTLPLTGSSSNLPLALSGFGLLLIGAGMMVLSKNRMATN